MDDVPAVNKNSKSTQMKTNELQKLQVQNKVPNDLVEIELIDDPEIPLQNQVKENCMQEANASKKVIEKQTTDQSSYVPTALQGLSLLDEFQDKKRKEKVCRSIIFNIILSSSNYNPQYYFSSCI